MLVAETTRFACVSGTNFGLAVVPDVCNSNAASLGVVGEVCLDWKLAGVLKRRSSGGVLRGKFYDRDLSAEVTARAGVFSPAATASSFGRRSAR